MRRGQFFVQQYQKTIDSGAAFSFDIGSDPRDLVGTSDLIDLDIIDLKSGATVAVVPLTPFVTADGNGFIAPNDVTTKFTATDGSTVTVPAGAFDQPTLVTAVPSKKSAFVDVPHFDDQLNYSGSLNINFDGVAKKRLDVEIPIQPGTPTANTTFRPSANAPIATSRAALSFSRPAFT